MVPDDYEPNSTFITSVTVVKATTCPCVHGRRKDFFQVPIVDLSRRDLKLRNLILPTRKYKNNPFCKEFYRKNVKFQYPGVKVPLSPYSSYAYAWVL